MAVAVTKSAGMHDHMVWTWGAHHASLTFGKDIVGVPTYYKQGLKFVQNYRHMCVSHVQYHYRGLPSTTKKIFVISLRISKKILLATLTPICSADLNEHHPLQITLLSSLAITFHWRYLLFGKLCWRSVYGSIAWCDIFGLDRMMGHVWCVLLWLCDVFVCFRCRSACFSHLPWISHRPLVFGGVMWGSTALVFGGSAICLLTRRCDIDTYIAVWLLCRYN